MVLVRFEDVKARQHKFVLFLDQLIQELQVVGVIEVKPGERVHILQELILLPWQRRLRPLQVGRELLGQARQLEAELAVADGLRQVGVNHAEDLEVLLQDKGLKQARILLIVQQALGL